MKEVDERVKWMNVKQFGSEKVTVRLSIVFCCTLFAAFAVEDRLSNILHLFVSKRTVVVN